MKNSRSTSIDQLDNFCIKIAANIIDSPLHHIICLSISQQKFPSSWKLSKVIPLHKKQCILDKRNYRPVSLLSPLSKVLEKIVYEQLYDHFNKNNIFNENLHGYRENRSTLTALLTMYDRWVSAADSGQISGAVFLDLSAAFDLVDPQLLIKKLKIYGIKDNSLKWIDSYLKNRSQAVWLDCVLSEFLESNIGVPQGSILGPLFFLIFFNDLPQELETEIDNYADDSTITASGSTLTSLESQLTADCAKVSDWMIQNKLKLNPDKTTVMALGTRERLRKLNRGLSVNMDSIELQEKSESSEKLLGCQVQANLKWGMQVSTTLEKLRKRLVGLQKIRNVAPLGVRKQVAEGVFGSVLAYCLPLYGGMEKGELNSMQVMQNKAARIAAAMPFRSNRTAVFDKLGWLTVQQLVTYHTVLLVFKIRQSNQPEYLAKRLNNDSRNGRIKVPYTPKLQLVRNSFCQRGASVWNRLPRDIRGISSMCAFKTSLKKWVLENVPRFPL